MIPINFLAEMTSIGTLVAFLVVSVGVMVLRRRAPDLPRGFKVPGYPVTPILSIAGLLLDHQGPAGGDDLRLPDLDRASRWSGTSSTASSTPHSGRREGAARDDASSSASRRTAAARAVLQLAGDARPLGGRATWSSCAVVPAPWMPGPGAGGRRVPGSTSMQTAARRARRGPRGGCPATCRRRYVRHACPLGPGRAARGRRGARRRRSSCVGSSLARARSATSRSAASATG